MSNAPPLVLDAQQGDRNDQEDDRDERFMSLG